MSTVIIRCDASPTIGGGHWIRCAALASELVRHGQKPVFVRRGGSDCEAMAAPVGCEVVDLALPGPAAGAQPWSLADQQRDAEACMAALATADVVAIVHDHYGLGSRWQRSMRERWTGATLIALDDYPWRPHACDMLVTASGSENGAEFAGLIAEHVVYRGGPAYALLRSEFAARRTRALERRESAASQRQNLLVSMGATDAEGLTCEVLTALEWAQFRGSVRVVLSSLSPVVAEVYAAVRAHHACSCELVLDPRDMAAEMEWADVAIGTAGQTSWERCALGLPSIVVQACDNQTAVAQRLAGAGAAIVLPGPRPTVADYAAALNEISDRGRRQKMGGVAAELCDGRGAERIAELLLTLEVRR